MEHPDPFVTRAADGTYYGTHTTMYNGVYTEWIFLYKSRDLESLFAPENRTLVWQAPKIGWNTRDVWAPELHRLDGVWYLYYSANGRTGVLANPADDPTTGTFTDAGRLFVEGADDWAIDGTVLEQNGKRYFLWSGITAGEPGVQKLFLSAMASPTKLTGPRILLSRPDHDWENRGAAGVFHVNEGPAVIHHDGRTFVTYSGSFCMTASYCLGLLWIDGTADPTDPAAWHKKDEPVFVSNPDQNLWGPGHNSFTVDAVGRDVIVFHAMESPQGFARRELFWQTFDWCRCGFPVFGAPARSIASGGFPER